jgi:ketosteroid isomerase-like protein
VNSWQRIALVCGLALAAACVLSVNAQSDPQKEIREVLDRQVMAWNQGDLAGYMAGYWQSPELSFFSGASVTRGWQATLDRYRLRYQSEGREMGKLSFSELEIEMLGPESAFVRGHYQLHTSKDNSGGIFTLIVKKTTAGWRIVHDHTSA